MYMSRLAPVLLAVVGVVLVAGTTARAQTTWYVDDDAPGGVGTSWNEAFSDLQTALTAASPGDDIHIGGGTYKPSVPSGRAATFTLIENVPLTGGYAGYGAGDPDEQDIDTYITTLSGDLGALGDPSDNCYHVITSTSVSAFTILTGLTITGGNANQDIPPGDPNSRGGGMYMDGGDPTLYRCTFTDNSAIRGGAIYMYNSVDTSQIIRCVFDNNTGTAFGGAIFAFSNSEPQITNSALTGNTSPAGGAIYTQDNCTLELVNCLLAGNSGNHGGAIYTHAGSHPTLTNCTLSNNTVTADGGGLFVSETGTATLANCVLWGNSDAGGSDSSAQIHRENGIPAVSVNYSCVQGAWGGTGNISLDPQYADADFRLAGGSPCNDAGDNDAYPTYLVARDLDWDLRFVDDPAAPDVGNGTPPFIDMGAYESQGGTPAEDWDAWTIVEAFDPPLEIPDPPPLNEGISVYIVIDDAMIPGADTLTLDDVDVHLRVYHYCDSELSISFAREVAPGTFDEVLVIDDDGYGAAGFDVILDDSASQSISEIFPPSGGGPIVGTYRLHCWPSCKDISCNDLLGFIGYSVGGTWRLHVVDVEYGGGSGWLFGWGMTFQIPDGVPDNIDNCPDHYNPDQEDCDGDEIGDVCAIAQSISQDCNGNGVPDECDVTQGTSYDCDANGVPDECEWLDCNTNSVLDACDILMETSPDCNGNNIPDECDLGGLWNEVFSDDFPDDVLDPAKWPVTVGAIISTHLFWADPPSTPYCLRLNETDTVESATLNLGYVSAAELTYYWRSWYAGSGDDLSVDYWDGVTWQNIADYLGPGALSWHLHTVQLPPEALHAEFKLRFQASCDYYSGSWDIDDVVLTVASPDCNINSIPDECDIAGDTSSDCNTNEIPDECDIAGGTSLDCNTNDVPDSCDISGGTSEDCNSNGLPDECDVAAGTSPDCNTNGVPDECDMIHGTSPDCNTNQIPDECDLAAGTSADCQPNGIPDECDCGESCSGDVDVDGSSTGTWNYPLFTYYHDARTTSIYLASEFGCDGGNLNALQYYVSTVPGQTMNNFTIRLRHTSAGSYSSATFENDGWTIVYQADETIGATGWYTFAFSTAFHWNGTSNLEVDVCFNNSSYTTAGSVYRFDDGSTRSKYYRCDSCTCGTTDPLTWTCTGYLADFVPRAVFVMSAAGTSGDCNTNSVPDECDITGGSSDDCNANTVPDECETIEGGDFDNDEDVDLDDFAAFVDCVAGPDVPPDPASPECAQMCLDAFDNDDDADVDLDDFAAFQAAFTGS